VSLSLAVQNPSPQQLRFGEFRFDLETGELWRGSEALHVRRQAADVLAILLRNPGCLVRREELRAAVAGGAPFGDFDQGVNDCIREIRAALDDAPAAPTYIETLPRRGYRFNAAVEPLRPRVPSPEPETGLPAAWRDRVAPRLPQGHPGTPALAVGVVVAAALAWALVQGTRGSSGRGA
jgi:DNA-binding winged helix-turn-helix (wHTH) protein